MESRTEKEERIKVSITDDHPLVIEGLEKVLATIEDIKVLATYNRGALLLSGIKHHLPDVLLLDVQLPDISGRELANRLLKAYPDLKILVLSGVEGHNVIHDMIKTGCLGYILKSGTSRELLNTAIHEVHKGNLFIDPTVSKELFHEMLTGKRKKEQIANKITEREKEILELVLKEMDNQEIADELCLSIRTVENHRYNVLQKLDVKNTVGLVKAAIDMGLGKK